MPHPHTHAHPSTSWLKAHWAQLAMSAGLLAVFFGNQGFRGLISNWLELRSLSREIAALDEEHAKTAARLKALRESEAALEGEARKLGYIKPDEVEYRFDPPKP